MQRAKTLYRSVDGRVCVTLCVCVCVRRHCSPLCFKKYNLLDGYYGFRLMALGFGPPSIAKKGGSLGSLVDGGHSGQSGVC